MKSLKFLLFLCLFICATNCVFATYDNIAFFESEVLSERLLNFSLPANKTKGLDSLVRIFERGRHDSIRLDAGIKIARKLKTINHYPSTELLVEIEEHCSKVLEDRLALFEPEKILYLTHLETSIYLLADHYNLVDNDIDAALTYYKCGLPFSLELGNRLTYTKMVTQIAAILSKKRGYKNAMNYCQQGIKMSEAINDTTYRINLLYNLGNSLSSIRKFDTAIIVHKSGLLLSQKSENKNGVSIHIYNLGTCYKSLGKYDIALEYFHKSWEIYKEENNGYGVARILKTMGDIYLEQNKLEKAYDYLLEALKVSKAIKAKEIESGVLSSLGNFYELQGDLKLASESYNKGLKIAENHNYKLREASSLNNLGNVYLQQEELDSVLILFKKSFSLYKEMDSKSGMSTSLLGMGDLFFEQKRYGQALRKRREAYTIIKKLKDIESKRRGSLALYESYRKYGNKAQALSIYENYTSAKDSLARIAKQKVLYRQEYQREFEKKAVTDSLVYLQEQQIVQSEVDVYNERLRSFIIGLVIAQVFLGGLIYLYLQLKKTRQKADEQAEELKILNKVKFNFFTNISHQLRTPLTLILGPLSHILEEPEKIDEPEVQKQLLVMQKNGKSLLQSIEEVLDLSKLNAKKLALKEVSTNVHEFIEYVTNTFEPEFKSLELNYSINLNVAPELQILMDRKKMERVLNKFISNAIKSCEKNDHISISVSISEEKRVINFSVKDTGKGIGKKELKTIFDRFHQNNNDDQKLYGGTGMGLLLVKEFANLMKGKVYAESTLDEGSNFHFRLPLKRSGIKILNPILNREQEIVDDGINLKWEDFIILVVEGNKDMSKFIEEFLNQKFQKIVFVEDGAEALEIIEKYGTKIDLIISDVILPEMDGLTLVKTVKDNKDLFTIPFILLTALATECNKAETLFIGVDDYLTKPFSGSELLTRVQNVLVNCYMREQAWKETDEIVDVEVLNKNENKEEELDLDSKITLVENSKAQVLIKEMTQYIERNFTNAKIDVEDLAKAFQTTKKQLNNTLKLHTGLTPAKFIKEVQLQSALQLLEEGSYYSISDLGFQVGFDQVTTFTTLFEKRFGISPSVYNKFLGQ